MYVSKRWNRFTMAKTYRKVDEQNRIIPFIGQKKFSSRRFIRLPTITRQSPPPIYSVNRLKILNQNLDVNDRSIVHNFFKLKK
jgi:hypothetical protein